MSTACRLHRLAREGSRSPLVQAARDPCLVAVGALDHREGWRMTLRRPTPETEGEDADEARIRADLLYLCSVAAGSRLDPPPAGPGGLLEPGTLEPVRFGTSFQYCWNML